MNYYKEIKELLIENEIYKKVKDYSKNRNELNSYYNVGKILSEAGNHYGDSIIEKYSNRLMHDVGKKYDKSTLFKIRKFYIIFSNEKVAPLVPQLSWSHCLILLPIKNIYKINYYIYQVSKRNLSKRQLRDLIKNNEYERLNINAKNKLINCEEFNIGDEIKHPIKIFNRYKNNNISEKMLKQLILENIDAFLKELGEGFCYIENEFKIKIGNGYNYLDMLLFNIKYNCYVVIELKVTELKKEHVGQIKMYMNYIDKEMKNIYQNNTIGIIIAKRDNMFVMEYCSDERIYRTTYEFI